MRIGIDVGGTNTDAVLMQDRQVLSTVKTPTTSDVTTGIINALRSLLKHTQQDMSLIESVMIGTTHFTNAIVERRQLAPCAIIRMGLPAATSIPPMTGFPPDLFEALGGHIYMAHGAHEVDGKLLSPLKPDEITGIAEDIKARGIKAIAITSIFSSINSDFEQRAADLVRAVIPDARITLSHTIGRIGLLERENAAMLNACLSPLAETTVNGFRAALEEMNLSVPLYISQNDGTLANADFVKEYPALTFASGPTNSMRGAAFLTGMKDAIIIDVGGTTTDIGMLVNGFPRVAVFDVEVGGVRTNFRMPDTLSLALGGGTIIRENPFRLGPQSVGHEISTRGLVFGGDTLTITDVAVASGWAQIGNADFVNHLQTGLLEHVQKSIQDIVETGIDRIKTSATDSPAIVVGGGSIILRQPIRGISKLVRPAHFEVANAIGAAIAQVGGEVDQIYSLADIPRSQAIDSAKKEAIKRAIAAGADPDTIDIVDIEEIVLAYLPGSATRILVKAVGELGK